MITITINNNSDTVTVHDPDNRPSEFSYSFKDIKNILLAVLNSVQPTAVVLEFVDEDEKTVIEEW